MHIQDENISNNTQELFISEGSIQQQVEQLVTDNRKKYGELGRENNNRWQRGYNVPTFF